VCEKRFSHTLLRMLALCVCLLLKGFSITHNFAADETPGTTADEKPGAKRANHSYFLYHQNLVNISLYIFYKFTMILRLSFLWLSVFLDFFQKVTRLDRFLLKWSFLIGS